MTILANGFRCAVLAPCLIVLALSGCVKYAREVAGPSAPTKPAPPPPSGTRLKSQLQIGMSTDYMPLAFKDPALGLVGVEVEFAERTGRELGKTMVFVETPFPELVQSLLEDRIDIIMSGMTIASERAERINFTDPYTRIGQMALVPIKERFAFPDIQSFYRLTVRVGFVQKTSGELAATTFFPQAMLVPQPTIEGGIAALRKGEIAVFIHDAPTIWRVAGNPNEKELAGLYWPLTKEALTWAVRKDDDPLRFALNELENWKSSGNLNRKLSRWVTHFLVAKTRREAANGLGGIGVNDE